MKRIVLIAIVSTALAFAADDVSAQNSIGANAGYNFDAEEFFVGGQFRFAPATLPVIINPSLETYFIDGASWLRFDINALYPFGANNTTFTPYSGAGLGLNYINPEIGDSETDAMLNLVFGAEFGMGRMRPFGEARIDVGDGTGASLRGGLLIGL